MGGGWWGGGTSSPTEAGRYETDPSRRTGHAPRLAGREAAKFDLLDRLIVEQDLAAGRAFVAAYPMDHDGLSPGGRAVVAADPLDPPAAAGGALLEYGAHIHWFDFTVNCPAANPDRQAAVFRSPINWLTLS